MDRNRESVWIETPVNVNEEIRRAVAAVEEKRNEDRNETGNGSGNGIPPVRNPLSKFSVCGQRDLGVDRPKTPTTPEVRLLGEPPSTGGSVRSNANRGSAMAAR